jgi:predicted nucleic acid-binding protein
MADAPVIVLDACALAGTVRRHILSVFAFEGAYVPVVSEQIMTEVRYAIPKTMKATGRSEDDLGYHAELVCGLFLDAFPDALRDQSTSILPDHKPLPDPDDEHVLNLAHASGAGIIVTENLKDFPQATLRTLNITALSTDRFLDTLILQDAALAERALMRLHTYLQRGRSEIVLTLDTLKRTGLRRTQKRLHSVFFR